MHLINAKKKAFSQFFITVFLAALLFSSNFILHAPSLAYADIRKSDIVLGQSIDSRGLSIAQSPNLDAQYAVVMDEEGTVFFERDSHTATKIASVTKIMTAVVAMETAEEGLPIKVSQRAAQVGESSASLQEGDVMTFEDALKALMIPSGNDAAIALAESIGEQLSGGSVQGKDAETLFVELMNKKADELGLDHSVFTNPHGLDDGIHEANQQSCAMDVAILSREAMKNDFFRETVATKETEIPVTRSNGTSVNILLESTDEMLGAYEGACGIKTGFTSAAGSCFSGAVNRGKGDLYAVVLDSSSDQVRFVDTTALFDWAYEHTIEYPLAHSSQEATAVIDGQTQSVPIVAEVAHSEWIDKTIKATLEDPFQAITLFDLNGNVNQEVTYNTVTGNVKSGDVLGTMTFKQRNDVLVTVDLIACEDADAPDLLEGVGIWWDRFFRGFSGEPTVAESVLLNQTPLLNSKASAA